MQTQATYRDTRFFLIAIAFISAFNYYLTYNQIRLNAFLVLTYLIDTIEGWLAWWAVRSIIRWLDKKMPYGSQPLHRILVQVPVTTITGLVVIVVLTELVSWIAKGKPAPLNFYLFDVFIFVIWFFVINGIYIGMHYYFEWTQSEQERREERKIRAGGFPVKQGKQNLLIPFEDMVGFYSEDGYSILLTWQGKKYFPDKSLEKIESSLPSESFFRLNRQFIIHRKAITGYKRTGDGKLDVLLNGIELLPDKVQVSRLKAVSFKQWFQPDLS